ncbi:MAG: T9SS type B sorting domain-containing protein [Bacteroidetes bacterium]|nr:T9SS type B sorting domain-containing protein [Bacteroidota bacterium]
MKRLLSTFIICVVWQSLIVAQGVVNNGAQIVIKNDAQVVINKQNANYLSKSGALVYFRNGGYILLDGNWINNSSNTAIASNSGTVVLTGDTQHIAGTTATSFNNLFLRGNGDKILDTDALIGGGQSGKKTGSLDMQNHNLIMFSKTLVVNNSATNAIQTGSGKLIGETDPVAGYSTVQWNIRGAGSGNSYVVPFGTTDFIAIPVTFNISGAGAQVSDSGYFSISTYPTDPVQSPNNRPLPTGVTNFLNQYKVENDIKSVDRFYVILPGGYASQPSGNIEFPYVDREWDATVGSSNNIIENELVPARFLPGGTSWDYSLKGSAYSNGNYCMSADLSALGGIYVLQNIPPCPVASFSAKDDCLDIGILSKDSSFLERGYIDSSVWLTDGIFVEDQNVFQHYFKFPGIFPIERRVRSDRGCWDTVTRSVKVFPLPTSDFVHSDTCLGEVTLFSATSTSPTGLPITYEWLIDGNNFSTANITHQFSDTGSKPIQLVSVNAWGCRDTIIESVEIEPLPVVDFQFTDICEGVRADFINQSETKGSLTQNRWRVDDLVVAFTKDYSQTFNKRGNYNVTLHEMNSFGCIDSATKTLVVKPRAVANFSIFPKEIYITEPYVNLVQTSSFANTYEWELGDMSGTEFGPEVFHTYNDTGLFSVRLIAGNDQNCPDTIFKVILIKPALRIFIPNAFNPGEDGGINSTFKPGGMLYGLKEMTMDIYNRWGEQLYHTDDINKPWDGTYLGKTVKEGVYLYVIKTKDVYNQVLFYKGTVTVVR